MVRIGEEIAAEFRGAVGMVEDFVGDFTDYAKESFRSPEPADRIGFSLTTAGLISGAFGAVKLAKSGVGVVAPLLRHREVNWRSVVGNVALASLGGVASFGALASAREVHWLVDQKSRGQVR